MKIYFFFLLFIKISICRVFQAEVGLYAAVLEEEGAVQKGRLLLEEEEGRQDDKGGPHEAQGPRHGGTSGGLC